LRELSLHHELLTAPGATPERWLFVLHGIFGAGRNWATLVRRAIRERPEWGAVLVDLREHGNSRGFPPPHTLEAAADDLALLVRTLGLRSDAVLGHSFGGKVALMYGSRAAGEVDELWIIDSTPEARESGGSAAGMLRVIRRHPGPFGSRDELVQALVSERVEPGIAQWMATNLELIEGEYRWRLDFDAMDELLQDFFRTDLWEIVEATTGPRIHFVRAESASVLSEEAVVRIEAAGRANGRVYLHQVAGGHWLNADNPDAVVRLLVDHL
jgi:pimeloyl-ACP methyl ester carboxylesterase